MVTHPAKFSAPVLEALREAVHPCSLVLDPFAGTGRVHDLGVPSWGIEIEPEWAALHERTLLGNALDLPFGDNTFDGIVTSPTYGNRMADHHNARDSSRRNTYRHTLGRALHPSNSGQLQWGSRYRAFHLLAWQEAQRVLKPGGRFILNVSDHIRKGERIRVSSWHLGVLRELGFQPTGIRYVVETLRQRMGANGHLRVDAEYVFVLINGKPCHEDMGR